MITPSDTTDFAIKRWEDAVDTAVQGLSLPAGKNFCRSCHKILVALCRADLVRFLDRLSVAEERDWQTLYADIQKLASEAQPWTKRQLNHLQPLPRTVSNLIAMFKQSVSGKIEDFSMLYGLIGLNIKVREYQHLDEYALYYIQLPSTTDRFQLLISSASTEKLERTVFWMRRMRSIIELFNRCLNVCSDMNEARLAMADIFGTSCALLGGVTC
jgi:hypothetical protein